jgi:hypothetical protein
MNSSDKFTEMHKSNGKDTYIEVSQPANVTKEQQILQQEKANILEFINAVSKVKKSPLSL